MNETRTNRRVRRGLRRAAACVLAVVALWMLVVASPGSFPPALLEAMGGSARLVTGALAAQLGSGPALAGKEPESLWVRLLSGQSSLLGARGETEALTPPPERPRESEQEEERELPAGAEIVERHFRPLANEVYEQAEGVYILNRTTKELDMAALASAKLNISLSGDAPQILILHTHGSEAYTPEGEDTYQETDTARTTDMQYNIIRVGDEIERIFTEMGLVVLHDRNLYDYPHYNGSYGRSCAAAEQYLSEYPSIQVVLDIHRDALIGEDGTVYKAVTEIDGQKAAQVLLVVGTDDGGDSHPNWTQNLSFAMRLQYRMNTLWPGLARPITLRASRFNQQLTEGSVLVEIGAHGNSLQEALVGARHFARAAGQVLLELRE